MLKPEGSSPDLCVTKETIRKSCCSDAGNKPQWYVADLESEEKRNEVAHECGAENVFPVRHHNTKSNRRQIDIRSYRSRSHEISCLLREEQSQPGQVLRSWASRL